MTQDDVTRQSGLFPLKNKFDTFEIGKITIINVDGHDVFWQFFSSTLAESASLFPVYVYNFYTNFRAFNDSRHKNVTLSVKRENDLLKGNLYDATSPEMGDIV